MSGALLAGLIATVITVAGGYLTQRSSSRALARSAESTSRSDIERDAYLRAEGFYKNTIAEQDSQIAELKADLAREKLERAEETRTLRTRLTENERETTSLRIDLESAKRTIRVLRAVPDDTDH